MNALLAFSLGILAVFAFEEILQIAGALRRRARARRQRMADIESSVATLRSRVDHLTRQPYDLALLQSRVTYLGHRVTALAERNKPKRRR